MKLFAHEIYTICEETVKENYYMRLYLFMVKEILPQYLIPHIPSRVFFALYHSGLLCHCQPIF